MSYYKLHMAQQPRRFGNFLQFSDATYGITNYIMAQQQLVQSLFFLSVSVPSCYPFQSLFFSKIRSSSPVRSMYRRLGRFRVSTSYQFWFLFFKISSSSSVRSTYRRTWPLSSLKKRVDRHSIPLPQTKLVSQITCIWLNNNQSNRHSSYGFSSSVQIIQIS